MTKYARIKDLRAIDVWRVPEDFGTIELLNRCLPGGGFIIVPDDTMNGAADNGDGTYTNPSAPSKPPTPQILSATAFQDVCETAFGGNGAGRTRFGAIVKAMQASADDEVFAVFKRYEKSSTFEKAKVHALLTLLRLKGVANITLAEINAVMAGWPAA